MGNIELNKQELEKHLTEQLYLLNKSATDFDNGDFLEFKRMALSLRILLHDTSNSKSLFSSLGLKNRKFLDYSFKYDPGVHPILHSLVSVGMISGRYLPVLDGGNNPYELDFEEYWNKIVFKDNKNNQFSRKDLVLAVADKDGGAHVDKTVNEAYFELSRNNSIGWVHNSGDTHKNVEGAEMAAIRQIAHEILKVFDTNYKYKAIGDIIIAGVEARVREKDDKTSKPLIVNKVGRNDLCPCGSNKKFKKCCRL